MDFLSLIAIILIVFSYLIYFLMIFIGKKHTVSKDSGFDVTKAITSQFNSINVIESKGYFCIYNMKRRVIKLNNMCYYGKSLSEISISLIEAGVSFVDDKKNKYVELYRKVFSNLKILYLFPIIMLVINNFTYSISDVRVGILFALMSAFVSYSLIDIKGHIMEWLNDNLKNLEGIKNENCNKIINYITKIFWLDKFIFLGELIIIVRFVAILLRLL
jgi:Zn-dependent membrane protease YugP